MSNNLRTFPFHQEATEPSGGEVLYPANDTEVSFSIEGSATNIKIQFEAQTHKNGLFLPCFCYTLDSNPVVSTETNTLNDSIWRIDLLSLYSFRVRIIEISGGSIDVIGKVVER